MFAQVSPLSPSTPSFPVTQAEPNKTVCTRNVKRIRLACYCVSVTVAQKADSCSRSCKGTQQEMELKQCNSTICRLGNIREWARRIDLAICKHLICGW